MVKMKKEWTGDATTPHPPPPKWPEGPERIKEGDVCIPPNPPPKRIIKEDISKEFFKGMLWALLIVILLHVGLAYILLY
jgi:hypothetical protein